MLECENAPPVLVNAHPLFPACQLSDPWAFARAVTVHAVLNENFMAQDPKQLLLNSKLTSRSNTS